MRAASCSAVYGSSSERRCAVQISKLQATSEANNEFGPIRAPENNDFWRPSTAKLPLPVQVSSPQPTKHAFHIPICSGLIPLHNPQISYIQSYTTKYENQYHWHDWRRLQGCTALGRQKKKREVGILGSCLPCFFFVYVPGTWYWCKVTGAETQSIPLQVCLFR